MNNLVIGAAIVILIIIVYYLAAGGGTSLSTMQSAEIETVVPSSKLPTSESSNFTYSTWFFVRDWSDKYGMQKVILQRGSDATSIGSGGIHKIYLGETENNMNIAVNYLPPSGNGTADPGTHICKVSNVPLQKWVNLIVSVYGRSMDVYIDGKLIRTCVLPGPVMSPEPDASISITPNGGFVGFTSQFVYWSSATNPSEAKAIYKKGYGGSVLGNLFNRYRMQLSFIKDGTEMTSFQI